VTGSRSASIGVWSEFRLQIRQGTPLALGAAATGVCSYLALAISARLLGVDEFGVLGAILAAVSVVVVAMRPLHTAATHLAARAASDRRILTGLTGPSLAASLGITCSLAIALKALELPLMSLLRIDDARALWLAAPLIGLQLLWLLESGLIAGTQRFDWYAINSITDAFIRAVVMAPLTIAAGAVGSLTAYATGVAVAGVLSTAQLGGVRWRLSRHVFDRHLFQVGGGSILLTLTISAVQNLDLLFLRTYTGPEAVGWYAACATVGSFLFALSAPLYIPLYPRVVHAVEEHRPTWPILLSVLLPLLAAGVVGVGVCAAIGHSAIGLFFGAQFTPAGDLLPAYVMKIVSLGALFVVGQYALATHRWPTIVPGAVLAMAGLIIVPLVRPEPLLVAVVCAAGGGTASLMTLLLQRTRP
jgi:O-antigen/teichoic acid export membrane protein